MFKIIFNCEVSQDLLYSGIGVPTLSTRLSIGDSHCSRKEDSEVRPIQYLDTRSAVPYDLIFYSNQGLVYVGYFGGYVIYLVLEGLDGI